MTGHVRQRAPGRWELRVYVGRDALTGRKKYVTRTIDAAGRREADRALAAFVTNSGQFAIARGTFGELVEQWYAHASPSWSPSTALTTRQIIDQRLARPIIPGARALFDLSLEHIRPAFLDAYYRDLRARGGKHGGPLAASTVARVHVVIRRALEQAVRWEWLPANPAARATPGKVEGRDVVPPAAADVLRLLQLAEAADPELAVFLVLAAATGARRGELAALRWTDFGDGTLTIGRALAMGPAGMVEKRPKSGKARTIAVAPTLAAVMAGHRARCAERALACGVSLPAGGFVFAAEPDGSRAWQPHTWTHRFARLRAQADLDSVRLHDLRHFVVTTLLSAGVDLVTVAGRVGHARGGRTTQAVYAHFQQAPDRAAAELLERIVLARSS